MKSNAKGSGHKVTINRSRGSSNKPASGKYALLKAVKELNAKRKKARLSLQEIATAVGRKRHAVWKWLNGLSRPEVPIRLKVQAAYGVKAAWWLHKTEEKAIRAGLQIIKTREKNGGKLLRSEARAKKTLLDTLGAE